MTVQAAMAGSGTGYYLAARAEEKERGQISRRAEPGAGRAQVGGGEYVRSAEGRYPCSRLSVRLKPDTTTTVGKRKSEERLPGGRGAGRRASAG